MKKLWPPLALLALLLGLWTIRSACRGPAGGQQPREQTPATPPAPPASDSNGELGFRIPRLRQAESSPSPIGADRVPAIFSRLNADFRAKSDILWEKPPPRFERESATRLREARLLVLAFPDQTLPLLAEMAGGVASDDVDRDWAVRLLHFMGEAGNAAALTALANLARNPNPTVASLAILELAPVDTKGLHRSALFERSSEGNLEAMGALGAFGDPEAKSLLEAILRNPREDALWAQAKLAASRSLEQCTLLQSEGAEASLREILSGLDRRTVGRTAWALTAAQLREWKGLQDCLRERISKGAENVLRRGPPGESSYARDAAPAGLEDYYHDELLVTYARIGGPLDDLQERRLATFGYRGDPRERLAQLLAPEK